MILENKDITDKTHSQKICTPTTEWEISFSLLGTNGPSIVKIEATQQNFTESYFELLKIMEWGKFNSFMYGP